MSARAQGRPGQGGAVQRAPEPLAEEAAAVSGRAAVEAAVVEHERSGAWRLPHFASHGDSRLFQEAAPSAGADAGADAGPRSYKREYLTCCAVRMTRW
eukprot:3467732-Prymnesium_polylepis.1